MHRSWIDFSSSPVHRELTKRQMSKLEIAKDVDAMAEWAADMLCADLREAAARYGTATWVAAGGSTPAIAYRLLAQRHTDSAPWERVCVLMGDERCVPQSDPESNWGQLQTLLLDEVPVPPTGRLRPTAERGAEEAAASYARALERLDKAPSGHPRLDHAWLGMGEDGHTLSLFPGRTDLAAENSLVVAVHDSPKPPPDRVSLTFECLKGVQHCVVIAAGAAKRRVVEQAIRGDLTLPVARAASTVLESGGRVTWLLDVAAAGKMT
jgi:6-phosphogluconolactonase